MSMKKKFNLKKISESKMQKYLFITSLTVCLILGIALSYNFDFTKNYNLLFESDTTRVISDMTNFKFFHYRAHVHPLFVILTEPIYYLVKAIFINKMLSLVVISSIATSLTVLFIYKILSLYGHNKFLKILTCLCYLFTFSNIIFTAGIEVYNIAVLFLVLLWYYVLKKYPEKNSFASKNFILITLGILAFGVTITNIFIFLIIIFFLFLFKKISLNKALSIIFFTIVLAISISAVQCILWHNTKPLILNNFNEEKNFSHISITPSKIINVLKNDYYYSIIGNDMHVESNNGQGYRGDNYVITFNENYNVITFGIINIFYILFLAVLFRNYKKNLFANLCLTSAILFNTVLHIFYGNELPFLYSMHFLYLFYLGFGINLMYEKNKILLNITKWYLVVLLIFEVIFNNHFFVKVIKIVKTILPCNYYVANFGVIFSLLFFICIIFIIALLIYLIYLFYQKFKTTKNKDSKIKYGVIMAALIMAIQIIGIAIEANEAHNMFFFKRVDLKSNRIYLETDKYLVNNDKNFKTYFKKEIKRYNEYQKEYAKLLKKYNPKKVTFLNQEKYYFFGLGNRRKLMFKNDSLIDLETGEKLYSWNITNQLIIPNQYTVIIETISNNYIKIYEDNDGIHYNINGEDMIIEGTDTKINLYNFDNQKWANTKKVLYSEILFNIKNSRIYPNIIVYDNPWYRDAAMASMVLKVTNNTDLISDWINNINEIYDKQNRGISEPDNLGELLYIISTQDNPNTELISRIEKEANLLAENNELGYYLTGQTDFSAKPLYQNLWYQCGINNLKRNFSFNIKNVSDEYEVLTWWMNNKITKNKKVITDINYPYLSIAAYHKLQKGTFPMNSNLYPLSWEKSASEANYQAMKILDNYYANNYISPIHTWTAAEMLLLLLDENKELNLCYN